MNAGISRALCSFVCAGFALVAGSQVSGAQIVVPNGAVAGGRPQPYVAEFTITTEKSLSNGTILTQEFTEVQAWDARGRTMTAITNVPSSGDETPTTKVRVSDPVGRVSSTWDTNGKVATVIQKPVFEAGRATCPLTTADSIPAGSATDAQTSGKAGQQTGSTPNGLTATVTAVSDFAQAPVHVKADTTIEHLGIQTILGIEAHGSRVTQTTMAGAIGNSQPLVSTRESWQANVHGIGLTLREVDEDPQIGKRTTELVKFTLGEPDPASFQPPEGYEVATQEMHQVSCQQPAQSSQ